MTNPAVIALASATPLTWRLAVPLPIAHVVDPARPQRHADRDPGGPASGRGALHEHRRGDLAEGPSSDLFVLGKGLKGAIAAPPVISVKRWKTPAGEAT
jgi:hypothetical protein